MQFYEYSILGLRILCQLPYEIEILKEAVQFLHLLGRDAGTSAIDFTAYDLNVRLTKVEELPPAPENAVFEQGRLYSRAGGNVVMHMLRVRGDQPYACTLQNAEEKRFDCLYLAGNESRIQYSRQFSDLIGMETVFLQFHALMLHAAFVRWKHQGILFTAPSGTGKSTQAGLWEEYEHAEIINGDRAGLRLQDGHWESYGLPYAGSSGIYRNESAPAKAIIVLRQAKENKLRLLHPREAIMHLYPETAVHRWDKSFTETVVDLLASLTAMVPVYLLECRPDREAVELVKNILEEDDSDGQYTC
ncbi:hypothetical protein [Fusibacillus kribbianus]|uniref:hypothetical protein n=1 Tax=Fusibacillus kribbianus TaxID=3044208 RepID=UPI0024B61F15|nr:hypothetical protein [Ruminococcus sp. YH-rum2234]